jgi:hypothetical protein
LELEKTGFGKQNIEKRLNDVVAFFRNRWPEPPGDTPPVPEEVD